MWLGDRRKVFFFEKRSKKRLSIWLRRLRISSALTRKSFLLLFFKKEVLPAACLNAYVAATPGARRT
jgi:hypothetical protein